MQFCSRTGGLTIVCVATFIVAVGFASARADRVVYDPAARTAAPGHVAILGQIGRAGVYEIPQGGLTLSGLVQAAQGLGAEASGNVRVVRGGRSGHQTFYSPNFPYPLMNGDVLVFDRRQQGSSASAFRTAGQQGAPKQKSSDPNLVTVALCNLIGRPVVVSLIPEQATLRGLLQQLRQPLAPNAVLTVIAPGQFQTEVALDSTKVVPNLTTGTVIIVHDRSTVIAQNLPQLLNVIRTQDLGLNSTVAPGLAANGAPPKFDGRYSQPAIPQTQSPVRSVVREWRGPTNTTPAKSQTGVSELPLPEAANPGLNSAPLAAQALPRSGNPLASPAPVTTPEVQSGIPNPQQPLLTGPPLEGRTTDNLAPMSFPAPGIGPTVGAEPVPLIPIGEAQPGEIPVPDPRAVPLPEDETDQQTSTKTSQSGRRLDVAAAIAAGMATLIILAFWLQRRMNSHAAAQVAQASQAASDTAEQESPVVSAERVAASAPARPAARSQAATPPSSAAHPVPRPHFAQSAPTPSLVARNAPVAYDVVMPPETKPHITIGSRPSQSPVPTAGPTTRGAAPEAPGQSSLLDRVLASVQSARRR